MDADTWMLATQPVDCPPSYANGCDMTDVDQYTCGRCGNNRQLCVCDSGAPSAHGGSPADTDDRSYEVPVQPAHDHGPIRSLPAGTTRCRSAPSRLTGGALRAKRRRQHRCRAGSCGASHRRRQLARLHCHSPRAGALRDRGRGERSRYPNRSVGVAPRRHGRRVAPRTSQRLLAAVGISARGCRRSHRSGRVHGEDRR